jgi:hypothetical protein
MVLPHRVNVGGDLCGSIRKVSMTGYIIMRGGPRTRNVGCYVNPRANRLK